MSNRLDSRTKYLVTKEVDNFATSPRLKQLTSAQFSEEVSRELGTRVTVSNLESCVVAIGMRMSDLFKPSTNNGRSIYADLYKLEQRVAAIEKKIEGL